MTAEHREKAKVAKAIQSYKDLDVWRAAFDQCLLVYRSTKSFPKEELYGIVSQLRRCAASIPANIAEGYSRRYDREKSRFISIALGSNAEVETFMLIAQELEYFRNEDFEELRRVNDLVGRSLTNFYKALTK